MPGLEYDEQGSLATYFILTVLSLALFPSTLFSVRNLFAGKRKVVNSSGISEAKKAKARESYFGKPRRKGKVITLRSVLLLLGWFAFALLSYKVINTEAVQNVIYDPFSILGIEESLTDKQIKKAYKKLSLKFHPDKVKISENQTREDADAKFVEITKAYKALTDDVTRENWLAYGNPDGPQQREDVVAIPKWVIEGKNSGWILGVYGALFGMLLPYLVGKWWFGTRQYTRDGALNDSATTFFRRLEETSTIPDVVSILAASSEFGPKKAGAPAQSEEKLKAEVRQLEERVMERAKAMEVEGVMGGGGFETVQARRSAVLVWSHLLRVPLESAALREERARLLLALPPLLTSLLNISLARNWLPSTLLVMHLHSYLAQATLPDLPHLLQLPGISYERAREIEQQLPMFKREGWMKEWAGLGEEKVGELLTGVVGGVGEDNGESREVVKAWPVLKVLSARFKVTGETTINPSSIVQCIFKVRLDTVGSSPSDPSTPISPVDGTNRDANADADDLARENESEASRKAKKDLVAKRPPVIAHTPYWPEDLPLRYWALIADIKSERIIIQPILLPTLKPGQEEEVILAFQAPGGAGLYTFQAMFVCSAVCGKEVRHGMMMTVEEPPAVPAAATAAEEDDDISDPEEDSIAGQLAAMKGEKVKRKPVVEEGESDDDSSSDEDGPKKKGGDSSSSDSDSD